MNDRIGEETARWLAAQDGDEMDWAGFTDWLEADPRHRAAFDALALLDVDIARQRRALWDASHLEARAYLERIPISSDHSRMS